MSDTNSSITSNASVETFTPDVHARVRASAGRRDRLRAFLQGHLPTGVDIEVVLTPAVQTAAVLPADIDALVSSDATDLERQQAAQLLEGIDGEFIVLITTAPAPLERVPLIITVTDDRPSDVEAVTHELQESFAPVCSLTVATDCEPGTLAPDASALAPYYERQAAVYDVDAIDGRLNQFASLLTGL